MHSNNRVKYIANWLYWGFHSSFLVSLSFQMSSKSGCENPLNGTQLSIFFSRMEVIWRSEPIWRVCEARRTDWWCTRRATALGPEITSIRPISSTELQITWHDTSATWAPSRYQTNSLPPLILDLIYPRVESQLSIDFFLSMNSFTTIFHIVLKGISFELCSVFHIAG